MINFELVNMDGCLMASVEIASFRKAREYFNNRYTGVYYIISADETKKVNLK